MKRLILVVLSLCSMQAFARVGMGENKCPDGMKAIVHKIVKGTATSVTILEGSKVIVDDGLFAMRDLNRAGCARVENTLEEKNQYAEIPSDDDGRGTAN